MQQALRQHFGEALLVTLQSHPPSPTNAMLAQAIVAGQMAVLAVIVVGNRAAPYLAQLGVAVPEESWRWVEDKKWQIAMGAWFLGGWVAGWGGWLAGWVGLDGWLFSVCLPVGGKAMLRIRPCAQLSRRCLPEHPSSASVHSHACFDAAASAAAPATASAAPAGNTVRQNLLSTGAFEVSYAGTTVFSKLGAGRMPTMDELLAGLAEAIAAAAGGGGDAALAE